MDEYLDTLPEEVGVEFEGHRIRVLAFADDIILLSESKTGMMRLLEDTEEFFRKRGLKVNAKKCFSTRLSTTKKDNAPYVYKEPSYKIGGEPLKAVAYDTCFKYLGIKFNPLGKYKANITSFQEMITRLRKAPLKPYQKLELLRANVIPKILHSLVLGRLTKGLLQGFDKVVRQFVRDVTGLTEDIPISFYYTRIKDGGLGLPKMELNVPVSLLRRLQKLKESDDEVVRSLAGHERMIKLEAQLLRILGTASVEDSLSESLRDSAKADLYEKIDGKPLSETKDNPSGQLWVTGKTNIVTGRTFRQLIQLRIGRLPTLENSNRGRDGDKKCRKCQRVNESLQHVIQHCSFTHFHRMRRHDHLADLIKNESEKNGFQTLWEPQFKVMTAGGLRTLKPDLVVITTEEVMVIDVSVVTEKMCFHHLPETQSLAGAWKYKEMYYRQEDLTRQLMDRFNSGSVWYGAIIISLRGIWCSKNDETLRRLKIPLSLRELAVVRTMEGSCKIWKEFMNAVK